MPSYAESPTATAPGKNMAYARYVNGLSLKTHTHTAVNVRTKIANRRHIVLCSNLKVKLMRMSILPCFIRLKVNMPDKKKVRVLLVTFCTVQAIRIIGPANKMRGLYEEAERAKKKERKKKKNTKQCRYNVQYLRTLWIKIINTNVGMKAYSINSSCEYAL